MIDKEYQIFTNMSMNRLVGGAFDNFNMKFRRSNCKCTFSKKKDYLKSKRLMDYGNEDISGLLRKTLHRK
jgi:hypothetical protein